MLDFLKIEYPEEAKNLYEKKGYKEQCFFKKAKNGNIYFSSDENDFALGKVEYIIGSKNYCKDTYLRKYEVDEQMIQYCKEIFVSHWAKLFVLWMYSQIYY